MAKWSGIGIPNTRRKLHRLRSAQRAERAALEKLLRVAAKQAAREGRPFDEVLRGCRDWTEEDR